MKYVILFCLLSCVCRAQSMKELLDSSEVVYPEVALAISRHETGHFKSTLFRKHNNAFGFRGKKGYKHYTSLQNSIQEYIILESKVIAKYSPKNYKEFLMFLARRYAKDPHWRSKIKSMI